MVEPARRHGPFDDRYPTPPKPVAEGGELRFDAVAGLDWAAFSARFFPRSRRHEFEAIAAYAAYRSESARATGGYAASPAVMTREPEGEAVARDARRRPVAGAAG